MKVLHVVTSFGMGGAETVAFQLAAMQAMQHEVHVLAVRGSMQADDPISVFNLEKLECAGCRVHSANHVGKAVAVLKSAKKIGSLHRQNQFDIVHSHTDIPDMCTSLANRLRGLPVARTIHNSALWPTRPLSALVCESGLRDELVVAIGGDTKRAYEELRSKLRLPISRYRALIPNAVERSSELSSAAVDIRNQLSQSSRLKLLFVGRLEEQKGFDILVEAMLSLHPKLLERVELHVKIGRAHV